MMKQVLNNSGNFKLTATISKKVHTMLKSHCAQEEALLGDFIEAGMILVLNKSKTDINNILKKFEGVTA